MELHVIYGARLFCHNIPPEKTSPQIVPSPFRLPSYVRFGQNMVSGPFGGHEHGEQLYKNQETHSFPHILEEKVVLTLAHLSWGHVQGEETGPPNHFARLVQVQ